MVLITNKYNALSNKLGAKCFAAKVIMLEEVDICGSCWFILLINALQMSAIALSVRIALVLLPGHMFTIHYLLLLERIDLVLTVSGCGESRLI